MDRIQEYLLALSLFRCIQEKITQTLLGIIQTGPKEEGGREADLWHPPSDILLCQDGQIQYNGLLMVESGKKLLMLSKAS